MTVLLIATAEQRDELLAYPVSEKIELKWITDPSDLVPGHPIAACIDLLFENTAERIAWLHNLQVPLVIINSVMIPLSQVSKNFIRINGWNTFLKRPLTEAAHINTSLRSEAEQLFFHFGRTIEWTPDIAGFITPRVVASIINEAFFTLEEKVSTMEEIDTAMKLGTNYPLGPFEWGKKIGLANIYTLLAILSGEKNRYTPSLLLKQTALA
jgi:3-hydroxybutyryl-CoA dehydrogenase